MSPTVGMHKVGVYRSTGTEQGLLEFIWMEGCSGRSTNPGPALAYLKCFQKNIHNF